MEQWSRKKLFVLYVLCIPLVAMCFTYYAMRGASDTVGLISENLGAIILFGITYSYLRAVLERKREPKSEKINVNLSQKVKHD
jgi:hypothetical protein